MRGMYALFTALRAVCYPPLHEQVFFREMLFTGSLNPNPSFFHQAGAVGYRSIAAFPSSPQVRWICQPRHVWDMDPRPQSSPLPQAGFAVSALTSSVWALLNQGAINPVLSCLDRPWKWCFWSSSWGFVPFTANPNGNFPWKRCCCFSKWAGTSSCWFVPWCMSNKSEQKWEQHEGKADVGLFAPLCYCKIWNCIITR